MQILFALVLQSYLTSYFPLDNLMIITKKCIFKMGCIPLSGPISHFIIESRLLIYSGYAYWFGCYPNSTIMEVVREHKAF